MSKIYDCGHSTDDASPPDHCPLCVAPKKSKFGAIAVRCPIHGYFPSKGEYKRFCELVVLQEAGHIRGLDRQTRYWVESIKQRVIWDFHYWELQEDGSEKEIVEDYKGCITKAYRRNCKWFRHDFPGIELRESRAKISNSKVRYQSRQGSRFPRSAPRG